MSFIESKGLVEMLRESAIAAAATSEVARTGAQPDHTTAWHYDGRVTAFAVALHYITGEETTDLENGFREQARQQIADLNAGRR